MHTLNYTPRDNRRCWVLSWQIWCDRHANCEFCSNIRNAFCQRKCRVFRTCNACDLTFSIHASSSAARHFNETTYCWCFNGIPPFDTQRICEIEIPRNRCQTVKVHGTAQWFSLIAFGTSENNWNAGVTVAQMTLDWFEIRVVRIQTQRRMRKECMSRMTHLGVNNNDTHSEQEIE